MAKKGTLLPTWLQGNKGKIGINNYKKLEDRDDYAEIQSRQYSRNPSIVNTALKPVVKSNSIKNNVVNEKRKLLNTQQGFDQPSNAQLPSKTTVAKPLSNMLPKKVVQQGKVPVQGVKRVDNPFAPLFVNALNTATLGSLEANNDGIKQLQQKSPITSTIGSMAGYALPFGAGSKLAKPITSKIAKPLLKRVVEGAVVGGGIEAVSGTGAIITGDKTKKEVARNIGLGVALGGAADLGLYGAGKLVSKGIKKFAKAPTGNAIPPSNAITPKIENPAIEPSQAKFNNMQSRLKSIMQNEPTLEPSTNNIKVGNTNTPINNKLPPGNLLEPFNTKTSEFKTNTLRNSEFLADADTQKVIKNIAMEYEVKPNAQTVNRAIQEVANDFDGVVNRIRNTEIVSGQGALNSAEDSASSALITNRLRLKAKETGDYTELKEWLEVLQPKVTNTAQSLQALKTWKDLSPEGTIFKAQQVVGEVNRAGVKTYGKNFKPIELTTGEIQAIGDSMEDVIRMPETTATERKAKERAFAAVKQVIGDKVPATLSDKVKALQRISLLLNPKTNVRNVLGNTILGTLENTKDIISAPLDKLVSLKTRQRTTLLPSMEGFKTQGKGLVKGVRTVIGDAKAGVNTSQSVGQFEISGDRIFNNKILNRLDKATNTALRFGDEPFYQAAYDESLRQQLKIAKTTEPTKEMLEKAKLLAEDRTLQNTSAMSEGFKGLQKSINKLTGNENLGIGTFAVPFAKTPANILDKAIDYSPVGSIKAITQLISKKTFNQKQFVDRIGRSIVGTGGIMLGYDLAKEGVITGQSNKDKDVAALDRQMGKSAYAFKSGDTYRTFDWAAPASIMLAIGADMYQEGKTSKDVKTVAVKAMTSGASTLFKQSLLQGFQKLFGYNDLVGGLTETAMNAPTQFVPTVLKQGSQLKDSSLKDTYDPDRFKKLGNQIKAKLPIASESLPTRVDTLGRDVKQFQGKNTPYNVLLNPSFTTKNVGNETERFVSKLYEETGLKTHFPKIAENKITYKVDNTTNATINLTADEKISLQRYIGQRTDKEFQVIAKQYAKDNSNPRTAKLAKTQIKELGNLLTDIYTEGEKKILEGRGIQEYQKGVFGKNIGNNPRN